MVDEFYDVASMLQEDADIAEEYVINVPTDMLNALQEAADKVHKFIAQQKELADDNE